MVATKDKEWHEDIAHGAQDKGKGNVCLVVFLDMLLSVLATGDGQSKVAPSLTKGKGKCKAHVAFSDEEGTAEVAEKQKKVPKKRKTCK